MKPITKNGYRYLSVFAVLAFIAHLVFLSVIIKRSILGGSDGNPSYLFSLLPMLWVSAAGLFFLRSTKLKQSKRNQILTFILTPIILSPILLFIYTLIVLLPLYSLAGQNIGN